jgi:hypothetical protein
MSMVMDILMALLDCNAGRCLHSHAQVIYSTLLLLFDGPDFILFALLCFAFSHS